MLSVIDEKWKDHLYDLDHLKASIGFRGWGQKDPLVEYKKEAYESFVDLMADIRRSVASLLFRAQLETRPVLRAPRVTSMSGPSDVIGTGVGPNQPAPVSRRQATPEMAATGVAATAMDTGSKSATGIGSSAALGEPEIAGIGPIRAPVSAALSEEFENVGRNDPCPCGSGKKFKKCHGAERVI